MFVLQATSPRFSITNPNRSGDQVAISSVDLRMENKLVF